MVDSEVDMAEQRCPCPEDMVEEWVDEVDLIWDEVALEVDADLVAHEVLVVLVVEEGEVEEEEEIQI
jgi:hypothetical protein